MKNSFDEILKKKWENIQFPIDDDHRNEMITLLDQQNRRRTGLFWWFGGIGGSIVIIAAVILLASRNEAIDHQMPVQPSANAQQEVMAQKNELDSEKQIPGSVQTIENDVVNEEILNSSKQDNSSEIDDVNEASIHDSKQINSSENNITQNNSSKSVLKQNTIAGSTNQKNE